MSRKNLLAKVHIAKKDLSLDDDTYRQLLQGVTGKSSCSVMSDTELEQVLSHFKRCGWKSKMSHRRLSPKTRDQKEHDEVDKIRAIWIDMYTRGVIEDGSETALDVWVKRTTRRLNDGLGVERVSWLRGQHRQLSQPVLEGLKQWQKRVLLKWMNEDLHYISQEQLRTDQPQGVVVKQLLEAHAISWWPLFTKLGIDNASRYCYNRRELNRD